MSDRIKDLLKKHHLKLVYKDIDSEGYIVHMTAPCPDFVFVKDGLSDEETEKVILHELGHAENDSDVIGDYKTDTRARSSSEHKANSFMISEKIKEYASLGYDIMNANYVNLADCLGTKDYWEVREQLAKYAFDK